MFEKLLALLPHNPGLAHQMAFYSRRMREEASIRRIGLVFIVLAFMVQFFAVISPPQSTSADSDPANSLIRGGVSSAHDAYLKCKANSQDYEHIMRHYGISCDAIDQAGDVTIHPNDNNNYWSMGHHPYGVSGEVAVNIPSVAANLYFRPLAEVTVGKGDCSGTQAACFHSLRVRNNAGTVFYIIKDCGNLVSVGLPHPVQVSTGITPTPAPTPPPPPSHITPTPTTPTTPTPPKTTPPCQYNASIPTTSSQCFQPCEYNTAIPATSSACFQPCQYSPSIPSSDINCKPCDKGKNAQDTAPCVAIRKAATNVTTGLADANNSTAKAGDTITYTLYATNNAKATIKYFTFEENIHDVLVYADVVDLHGGVKDNYDNVQWQVESIAAGATASHQITVKVKTPVPQTPADPLNPKLYDLTLTNVYGNIITINVPGSPGKTIEATTTSLPNTGPGTSLFIASMVVVFAGYFYSRARLLADESKMALQESAGA